MLSKKVILSTVFATVAIMASAQSSTNSPYTRFGFGDLSDQIFTNNAAMGGVGNALRSNRQINPMNPASYTSVDSLSFMFDIGLSLKSSNYEEKGIKSNAKNSSFDYLAMQFRLHPRLGISIGFTPYSTIGYNFTTAPLPIGNDITTSTTYFGEGGTNVIYGGLGFKILKNLSVGVNIGYLYGKHKYTTTTTLSNGGDFTTNYRNIKFNSYKLDVGLQYTQQIKKNHSMTLGVVYGLGHDISSNEVIGMQVTDGSSYSSISENTITDGFSIPSTYGVGLSYQYRKNLTVSFDYTLQDWKDAKQTDENCQYINRQRIAFGAEYIPNGISRNYLKRMIYRVGAYYNTPYFRVKDMTSGVFNDGAKEYGITAGLGFPLSLFQRKTVFSITGQYVKLSPSASNLMSENRYVIKLGLTLNEPWFMKWKVN